MSSLTQHRRIMVILLYTTQYKILLATKHSFMPMANRATKWKNLQGDILCLFSLSKRGNVHSQTAPSAWADPEGEQGIWTPPPPLKNHKNIGFLSNTGPDPLKNHKATKPVFNVGTSSTRQGNAI